MRRNIFTLAFFILSVFSCPFPVGATQGEVIPITVGDIERNKTFTPKERWDFMVEFYVNNKKNGVTDEVIINELIKLFELDEKSVEQIKKVAFLGQRYKTMEDMAQDMVNKINMSILEKNPGRLDLIVNINDTKTWKNIKNLYVGEIKVADFFKIFQDKIYLSNRIKTETFETFLMSCADTGKDDILMSIYLDPKGAFLAAQEEGKSPDGIHIDFSGSENLMTDTLFFPMEKAVMMNGKKVFGYDRSIYIPFKTRLENPQKDGVIHAQMTANVCRNNVCQKEVFPELIYKTDKSTFESALCQKNIQEYSWAPKSRQSGIEFEKAFFKKEKNGEVELIASFRLPPLRKSKIFFLLKNEQGLIFSEPFLVENNRRFLAKFRLLNPEQLKEDADLTFDIGYSDSTSEFNVKARIEDKVIEPRLSFFSFSFAGFFGAFFQGLKFFVLTPVLALFLLMLYQSVAAPRKTFWKSLAFSEGVGKMFLTCVPIVWGTILLGGFFPVFRNIIWGTQFDSPLLNFILLNVFLLAAANWERIFDDVTIERVSTPFEPLFYIFDIRDVREKAGVFAVVLIGLMMFITPMTNLYYRTYDLLTQSYLLYSAAFLAGLSAPLLILALFTEQVVAVEQKENVRRILAWIVCMPFCFQALMLLLSIGVDVERKTFLGAIVLLLPLAILSVKAKRLLNKGFVCVTLAGLFFIPTLPAGNTLNNLFGVDFDEALLRQQVEEGKNVYLNVTDNFCMSCLWNRFAVTRGLENQIKSGDLMVMRVGYDTPFMKKFLFQDSLRNLPMNIIFSPKYPEGKIIDSNLKMWAVPEIAEDAFVFIRGAPIQQIPPEEKTPDPVEKDTN